MQRMDNVIKFRTKEQWAREKAYHCLKYLLATGRITLPSAEEIHADMLLYEYKESPND